MIIAFEGIDGAGKNTLVTALEEELISREIPVARLGFPRYDASVHAQLASAALHGGMGDLVDSVYGMATLFALDRAEVAEDLTSFDGDGYVVLLDRWVASNAAYSAARLSQDATSSEVVDWVADLEFGQLGAPVPDLQVLVDVPDSVTSQRVAARAAQDGTRAPDAYEADGGLQARTLAAYRALAEMSWISPWLRLDNSGERSALDAQLAELADAVVDALTED
ncbi:dTMP kinase [Corynebacterium terpenotabidum]|uniref:Thymidylate kinase n=1 Tax=Corynebacterium terpenotabidum Y-11 TaxID=1200352 RepID=S4XFM9_9CORY|nr:dTMP kinase [Corynebacterium terpenotabidum]AGP31389.1 thymidylate kinase [Corynebacterium terpenotabidum Y-11]